MKLYLIAVAALAASFILNPVMAADDSQLESFKEECKKYAKEDGISKEEMKEYMTQCIEDLSAPPTAESEENVPEKE